MLASGSGLYVDSLFLVTTRCSTLSSTGKADYPALAEDTVTQRGQPSAPKLTACQSMGSETGLSGSNVPLVLRLWKLITGLREAPSGSKCDPGNVADSEELSFLPDPRAQDEGVGNKHSQPCP